MLKRLFTLSAYNGRFHVHLGLLLRELDHLDLVSKHLDTLQVLQEQG